MVRTQLITKVYSAVKQIAPEQGIEESGIQLSRPATREFGDWATPVALMLGKKLGKAPKEVAEQIVAALVDLPPEVESVQIAGPGFINFKLRTSYFTQLVQRIDPNYGKHDLGAGKKVMIEFGQPNTHKAFHVGHLRSAISGLGLVGLYENLGYEVVKANFYGDVGMHVAKCTWAAMHQGLPDGIEGMDVHQRMKFIDKFYVYGSQQFEESETVQAEIKEINRQIYAREQTDGFKMYEQLRTWSLEHLNAAFAKLGVVYDRQYPESEMAAPALEIVKSHMGSIFTESDGAIIFDGKKQGLTSWVFITKDGNPTYEAKDLALAYTKFREYNPDLSIITTSVEQADRFKSIIYCLEQIDQMFKDRYVHIPFGWLLRSGKKSSSRMGDSVKGVDVLQEAEEQASKLISADKNYGEEERGQISEAVALSGIKFLILSHEFHKNINYDPEEFITLDGFSGPFLQYALARASSILKQAGDAPAPELPTDLELAPAELALGQALDMYPEMTLAAGVNNAPHLLCNYLYDLAQAFNKFYAECPVLVAQEPMRSRRLRFVAATAQVLDSGLGVLSIPTLRQM